MVVPRDKYDWGALAAIVTVILAIFTGLVNIKVDIANLQTEVSDNYAAQLLFRQDVKEDLSSIKTVLRNDKTAWQ